MLIYFQQIVNERQFRRLKSLLDERTGHVVAGGNTAATSIEPTIVVDADPDSELMKGETPPRVAIQEAVRLAERFGTSASAKFVNGVLDAFARQAGMI